MLYTDNVYRVHCTSHFLLVIHIVSYRIFHLKKAFQGKSTYLLGPRGLQGPVPSLAKWREPSVGRQIKDFLSMGQADDREINGLRCPKTDKKMTWYKNLKGSS